MSTLMFKVAVQCAIPEGACVKQELLFPENYQSEANWAIYQQGEAGDPKADDSKLAAMAKRLKALGATRLTEKSFGVAAACALYKNGVASTEAALNNTRRIKVFFASQEKSSINGPDVYPQAPGTLEHTHTSLWQQICANGPIVESKVDTYDMAITKSTAACRNTKSGCRVQASGGHTHGYTPTMSQAKDLPLSMRRSLHALGDAGSHCTVFAGHDWRHNPYAQPPPTQPPMFRMPNLHGSTTPLGPPRYQPEVHALMDQAASAGRQASAQGSPPAVGGLPTDPPAHDAVPAGPAGLGLVAESHKQAKAAPAAVPKKAAPAAVPKKVAVKKAKALHAQSHGLLFCHTTLNHIYIYI